MIDGYMASKIAQMEHEERVRSIAPVYDYDVWLTQEAGNWQARRVGTLVAAIGAGLASIANLLKRKSEAALDSSQATAEPASVPGLTDGQMSANLP